MTATCPANTYGLIKFVYPKRQTQTHVPTTVLNPYLTVGARDNLSVSHDIDILASLRAEPLARACTRR